jgi:branched-chain amino acid transport system substrate-binding protein
MALANDDDVIKTFPSDRADQPLRIFQSLGTAPNTAIQRYMNAKKVPQLFVSSGATKYPQHFPWTMGLLPSYQSEARIYAGYLLENHPQGKIGVLYQNDDLGKDYLKGLKDGLNGKMQIVAEMPYEVTDPTVDSQIVSLKASGADIFLNFASAKFAAQAIKKMAELGWKPAICLAAPPARSAQCSSPPAWTTATPFDVQVPQRSDRSDVEGRSGIQGMDDFDGQVLSGWRQDVGLHGVWLAAQTLVVVFRRSGDNLTRENVMKQAASLKDLELGMLLPGIKINTGPNDFAPIKQMQMMRFDGTS